MQHRNQITNKNKTNEPKHNVFGGPDIYDKKKEQTDRPNKRTNEIPLSI